MKINKKSWHYRLLKWNWSEDHLVGYIAPNGMRYETAEDFQVAVGRKPSKYHTPPEIGQDLPKMSLCEYCQRLFADMFLVLPVMTCMLIVGSPFIALIYICCKIDEWWAARKKAQQPGSKEPRTLLGKWLKAKKEKVCPILEWE